MLRRGWVIGGALAVIALQGQALGQSCPVDGPPRQPGTLLTIQVESEAARTYDAASLGKLPSNDWAQRREVAAAGQPSSATSVSYGGVLLRDLLMDAGFGRPQGPRNERTAVIEAIATDGWRAVFSWGELFNHPLGDQIVVILRQDGRPLDLQAGPLALRSLSDARPGPRHVRNLCAVRVRMLP
jgi:hypothetical protein